MKVQIDSWLLQDLLSQIAKALPTHYKLTLVARNTNPDLDADIVLTDDDMEKAIAAIQKRIEKVL